jgi:hypothetical protein
VNSPLTDAICLNDIKNHNLTNPSAVTNLINRTNNATNKVPASPVASGSTGSSAGPSSGSGGGGGSGAGVGGNALVPSVGTTPRGRWFLGRWSNSDPQLIMKEVYRLLTHYGFV